jgi:branched-chain amino acid transport system permease protein
MMGVLNFAHASFYMLGAYFAYQISRWVGFWPALVIAPLAVGAIGAAVERYGLRTVHKYGHVAELLFTFGLAFVIEEMVRIIWGRAPVDYKIPPQLDFTLFTIYSTNFPAYRAFIMLVAVLMLVSIFLVLKKTRIGLIIQASLTHPEMVEALGHNVPRVFMLVFAGGLGRRGRWQRFRYRPRHGRGNGRHRIRSRRVWRLGVPHWRVHRLVSARSGANLVGRVRCLAR